MASCWDFVQGRFLTAKRLGKRKITGTITEIEPVTIKQRDQGEQTKLCITVDDNDPVPLNVGNMTRLSEAWGEDYKKWKGKRVKIESVPKEYMGQDTMGLQITPLK